MFDLIRHINGQRMPESLSDVDCRVFSESLLLNSQTRYPIQAEYFELTISKVYSEHVPPSARFFQCIRLYYATARICRPEFTIIESDTQPATDCIYQSIQMLSADSPASLCNDEIMHARIMSHRG